MAKRRILSLLLALAVLLTLGLSGCAGQKMPGTKRLTVQLGPDPETLDPARNSAADAMNILNLTFDTLLEVDESGAPVAAAAETWEESSDGLQWTFHLREGLKWSDGTEVTAKDYVYNWQRIADPNVQSPYAETLLGYVAGFDEAQKGDVSKLGVKAKNARTLVVTLTNPCPYFAMLVSMAQMAPVQKATVHKYGEKWAEHANSYVCNGPFTIKYWEPSSQLLLAKNPYYWNADAIHFDEIEFLLTEDSEKAYMAYQQGKAQLIAAIPTAEIETIKKSPDFHTYPSMATYYISMNLEDSAFADARVRKALSLAIDRKYLTGTVMDGLFTPAYNMIGPGVLDYDNHAFRSNANGGEPYISSNYKENLAKAKQLLAAAGHAGGAGIPTLTYQTNDADYHMEVAEYLKTAWAELGITLDIQKVKWDEFTVERRKGNYVLARNGWAFDYNDASNLLELFMTGNGNNDGRFSNAEYDSVMEAAMTEPNIKKRSEYLHRAEDILMEETACIPLAYYNDFYLISADVTGIWHSPTGVWTFQYGDFT